MSTGYSGTPLIKKLGIKPDARIYLDGAPPHYLDLLGALPEGVQIARRLTGTFGFLHLFAAKKSRLKSRLTKLQSAMEPDGMLWISWPKGGSSLATDLNGNIVRQEGLAAGLVDIKVCAVDEDWSGLKFVIPVAQRSKARSSKARKK